MLDRVSTVSDLVAADLMIEAVVEDADVKRDLFRRADEILPPEAILASNTSSIPIATLAAATRRPEKVIGMHFFNPVPVLKLVGLGDPKYGPCPLLRQHVAAGRLGRKSERGFYEY